MQNVTIVQSDPGSTGLSENQFRMQSITLDEIHKHEFIYVIPPEIAYFKYRKLLLDLGVKSHKILPSLINFHKVKGWYENYTEYLNDLQRLQNRDFTIISDNRWGGVVYEWLRVEFQSPFIGINVPRGDYIRLLQDLRNYLRLRLVFIESDKHPIALLGDVQLHFMHTPTREEAETKWYRRLERINWENLFVKFSPGPKERLIKDFDALDFTSKLCVTYSDLGNKYVWLKGLDIAKNWGCGDNEWSVTKQYFDIIGWLNSGAPTSTD